MSSLFESKSATESEDTSIMTLITWYLPLAALITPSTLTVVPSTRENMTMMHVSTLNFNDSSLYTFAGLGDGTSPLLTRLTSAMVSNMEVLPMQAMAPNTTYRHEFLGPSLKCDPATGGRLENMSAIWNQTQTALSASVGGKLMYLAYTMREARDAYGICPPAYGPANSARVGNESITCAVHDTHFDLDFRAVGNTQTITGMWFEWLTKRNVDYEPLYMAILQALATILNAAVGAQMAGPQAHSGDSGRAGLITRRTRVMSTALIGLVSTAFSRQWGPALKEFPRADRDLAANRTLARMKEELSRNKTLSLFSSERLWLPQNATNTTLVTQSASCTIYEHRSRNPVMTYGIAVAFSAFGVLLGLRALWLNGICCETIFSSIMNTARNKYLDELTLWILAGLCTYSACDEEGEAEVWRAERWWF